MQLKKLLLMHTETGKLKKEFLDHSGLQGLTLLQENTECHIPSS